MHLNPLTQAEAGALRKTFVPYKRSGFGVKGSGIQQPDEVKLPFDLVNPKKKFINILGNGKDIFALDRTKNFDRVYGLSERWGKLVPNMYDTLRESIRMRITSRGEVLNRQTIEAQLHEEVKINDYFNHRNEHAYLRSRYIQWIQQNCLESLVRELTS